MANKVHGRSYAREIAMQALFSKIVSGHTPNTNDRLANEYIKDVLNNEIEIKKLIKKHLKGWSIVQLNPVDLAILEIACDEVLFSDLPIPIIISEAVNLANKYSSADSAKFIHKVIGLINQEVRDESRN